MYYLIANPKSKKNYKINSILGKKIIYKYLSYFFNIDLQNKGGSGRETNIDEKNQIFLQSILVALDIIIERNNLDIQHPLSIKNKKEKDFFGQIFPKLLQILNLLNIRLRRHNLTIVITGGFAWKHYATSLQREYQTSDIDCNIFKINDADNITIQEARRIVQVEMNRMTPSPTIQVNFFQERKEPSSNQFIHPIVDPDTGLEQGVLARAEPLKITRTLTYPLSCIHIDNKKLDQEHLGVNPIKISYNKDGKFIVLIEFTFTEDNNVPMLPDVEKVLIEENGTELLYTSLNDLSHKLFSNMAKTINTDATEGQILDALTARFDQAQFHRSRVDDERWTAPDLNLDLFKLISWKRQVEILLAYTVQENIKKEALQAEKKAAEKAAADKLVAEKKAAEKAAADKILAKKKAAADKKAADKAASIEKAAADKAAAAQQKVAADKAAAEKAAAEKANAIAAKNKKIIDDRKKQENKIQEEANRLANQAKKDEQTRKRQEEEQAALDKKSAQSAKNAKEEEDLLRRKAEALKFLKTCPVLNKDRFWFESSSEKIKTELKKQKITLNIKQITDLKKSEKKKLDDQLAESDALRAITAKKKEQAELRKRNLDNVPIYNKSKMYTIMEFIVHYFFDIYQDKSDIEKLQMKEEYIKTRLEISRFEIATGNLDQEKLKQFEKIIEYLEKEKLNPNININIDDLTQIIANYGLYHPRIKIPGINKYVPEANQLFEMALGLELFSTNQIRNNLYLYLELFSRFLNTPTAVLFNNALVYFGTEKDKTDPSSNPTELGIEKSMDVLIFDEFMQDKEQSPQIMKLSEYMAIREEELFGSSDAEDNGVEEKPELIPEKNLANDSEPVVSFAELPNDAPEWEEYHSRKKKEQFLQSHSPTPLSELAPKEEIGEEQENLLDNPTKVQTMKVQTNEEQLALLATAIEAISEKKKKTKDKKNDDEKIYDKQLWLQIKNKIIAYFEQYDYLKLFTHSKIEFLAEILKFTRRNPNIPIIPTGPANTAYSIMQISEKKNELSYHEIKNNIYFLVTMFAHYFKKRVGIILDEETPFYVGDGRESVTFNELGQENGNEKPNILAFVLKKK